MLRPQLELGDNKLAGGLETLGQNCPALRHLSLVGNRLSLVEELAPLVSQGFVRWGGGGGGGGGWGWMSE